MEHDLKMCTNNIPSSNNKTTLFLKDLSIVLEVMMQLSQLVMTREL